MAEDGGGQPVGELADPPILDEIAFRENMSGWVSKPKDERLRSHFYFLLEGGYSLEPGALSVQSMRPGSPDHAIVSQLTRATAGLEVELFLVLLERGPGAESGEETGEESGGPKTQFIVRRMVETEGHPLASDYPIDDSQFYQRIGPKPDSSPDLFETAVLLITRDSLAQFFLDLSRFGSDDALAASISCQDLRQVLKRFADKCVESEGHRTRLIPVLRDLVVGIMIMERELDYALLTDHDFLPVQAALSRAREWEVLEQVVTQTEGRLGVAQPRSVGMLVKGGHVKMGDVEKWMMACVVHGHSIRAKCARLAEFFGGLEGLESKIDDEHRQWVMTAFDNEVLRGTQEGRLSFEDGNEVLTLVLRLFVLEEATVNYSLLALADKYASQSSFMIGLLVRLNAAVMASPSPCPSAKKLFVDLAQRTLKHLDISRFCISSSVPLRSLIEYRSKMPKKQSLEDALVCLTSAEPEPMLVISHEQLAEFVTALLQQRVGGTMIRQLAFAVIAKAPLIRRGEFATLWLPFLRKLIEVLEKFKIPPSKPRWSHIFGAIFDAFVCSNKGEKPEVVEWKVDIKTLPCGCVNCRSLAGFLCYAHDKTELRGIGTIEDVAHVKKFVLDRISQRTSCEHDVQTRALVIRKIGSYTEKTEREWAQAAEEAKRQIRRFEEGKLRQILGLDFSCIWNAENLVLPRPAPVKFPPPPPQHAIPHENAPTPVQAFVPEGQPFPSPGPLAPVLDFRQLPREYRFQAKFLRTVGKMPIMPQRPPPSHGSILPQMIPQARNTPSMANPAGSPNTQSQSQTPAPPFFSLRKQSTPAGPPSTSHRLPGASTSSPGLPAQRGPLSTLDLFSKNSALVENQRRGLGTSTFSRLTPASSAPASQLRRVAASPLPSITTPAPRPLVRNLPGVDSLVPARVRSGSQPAAEPAPSVRGVCPSTRFPPRIPRAPPPLHPLFTPGSRLLSRTLREDRLRRSPEVIILDDGEDDRSPQPTPLTSSNSVVKPPQTLSPNLTTPAAKPGADATAASSPSSSSPPAPTSSGSAAAFAIYEAEVGPRLRKKFSHLGQDSIQRALRTSWEAMSDRDRDTYKNAAATQTTSPSVQVTAARGTSTAATPTSTGGCDVGSSKTTPTSSVSKSSGKVVSSTRTVFTPTRGHSKTPLQATSANSQRGRPSRGAYGSQTGSTSASSGLKRKFTGPEPGGRENLRRRVTANGIDEATLAGSLYYPPVRPPGASSSPSVTSSSRTPTNNKTRGGTRVISGPSPRSKSPPVIDLTLDD